jgi:hypothetical protein
MLSADLASKAFARNLQYDPNVGSGRRAIVEEFVRRAAGPDPATRLSNGFRAAFYERVRTSSTPDFADMTLNGKNFVPYATATRPGVHPGMEFIRVFDLTGLRDIFRWALGDRKRYKILGSYTLDRFNVFLDDGLQLTSGAPKDPAEQRPYIDGIFQMINDFGGGLDLKTGVTGVPRPFHPAWVTEKSALDVRKHPDLRDNPERWLEILGIPKAAGRWLVLLSYNGSSGIQLARPSLMDSEPWAYFFPTPEARAPKSGGAAMDLVENTLSLVPEFVHVQQQLSILAWDAAGGVCRKTVNSVDCDFGLARSAHRIKLATTYDLRDWMEEVV